MKARLPRAGKVGFAVVGLGTIARVAILPAFANSKRTRLIAVVSRGQANAREVAYGTTQRFLELFGLRNLDDLPQTQDLQRL